MRESELLIVAPGLEGVVARAVASLARRYVVEAATPGPTTGVEAVGDLEVRRFAAVPPPPSDAPPGSLAEALARARAVGPWTPDLFEFLHAAHPRYRAILFFDHASPLTAFGLPLVPERAVLVPDARDLDQLGRAPYRALFHLPRAIGYRDAAERDAVWRATRNEQVPYELLSGADAAFDAALDRLVAMAVHV